MSEPDFERLKAYLREYLPTDRNGRSLFGTSQPCKRSGAQMISIAIPVEQSTIKR